MARQILDIRDLAREWRDLLDEQATELEGAPDANLMARHAGDRESILASYASRLTSYQELCQELGIPSTPDALEDFGDGIEPTLIHENYFTEYAQELAEEIGSVTPDLAWPMRHIDWEKAAEELKYDYTSVEYDGETYYIRARGESILHP